MSRILVTLPDDVVEKIDQEASDLLVSRNTYLNWIILGRDSEMFIPIRSRSDKPQKKLSSPK